MVFDITLAERIRRFLAGRMDVEEKKMMGGLTFMVNQKMCVGVVNDDLMARIGPDAYGSALTKPGCRKMDFTGREMKGFVLVGYEAVKSDRQLQHWLDLALEYNPLAPMKKSKK
jgi:TfoX/Sxy family transcriptional regulator of competence genes